MDTYQLYIGGKFVDAEDGVTRPTYTPYTGEPIATSPGASVADAEACYHSPTYQEALKFARVSAERDLCIVEGS